MNEYLPTLRNAPCSHGGWPSKNRATPGVATATPRPIGSLADVRAVVPNLSTGSSGKAGEMARGKWELVMEQVETDNNGHIYPPSHTASHFPLR